MLIIRSSTIIILLFVVSIELSSSHSENESEWYKRYPSYPEYCSTPHQLEARKIPPLVTGNNSNSVGHGKYTTQLLHVSTIIRHGARTPWGAHNCWSGFWSPNSTTSVWDCALTTITSPPAQPQVSFAEHEHITDPTKLDGLGAMFLYEKRYDALHNPSHNLKNELNGTCQSGQLLLRGYGQELHNGRMLRATYIRDKQNPLPPHAALFDLTLDNAYSGHNGTRRPYEAPHLYVRADDEERTVMSGQVLLRGVFGDLVQRHWDDLKANLAHLEGTDPTIVMHTADKWQDVLQPNTYLCPRLEDLRHEAKESEDYVGKFHKSDESHTMRRLLDELGGDFGGSGVAQDCMMTAICNDLDLPKLLDDYGRDTGDKDGPYGKDLFDRMRKFSYLPVSYILRYNDAAFSKLAFSPFWIEILSNILPHLPQELQQQYNKDETIKTNDPPPKLAIFSAHDLSILPLLATLGKEVWDGEEWAPYASLMVIELHDIILDSPSAAVTTLYPSGKAFRLAYNGDVLTSRMEGCPADLELCDISVLLDRVLSFATTDRDCDASAPTPNDTQPKYPVDDAIAALLPTPDGTCVTHLAYDGQNLTSQMEGCPADLQLCDVSVLLDHVLACPPSIPTPTATHPAHPVDDAIAALFATPQGACVFLLTVLASGFVGCLVTFVVLVGRFPGFVFFGRGGRTMRSYSAAEGWGNGDGECDIGESQLAYGAVVENKAVAIT